MRNETNRHTTEGAPTREGLISNRPRGVIRAVAPRPQVRKDLLQNTYSLHKFSRRVGGYFAIRPLRLPPGAGQHPPAEEACGRRSPPPTFPVRNFPIPNVVEKSTHFGLTGHESRRPPRRCLRRARAALGARPGSLRAPSAAIRVGAGGGECRNSGGLGRSAPTRIWNFLQPPSHRPCSQGETSGMGRGCAAETACGPGCGWDGRR